MRQLFSYIDRVDEFDIGIFGSLSFYSLAYTEHKLADNLKFKDLALPFAMRTLSYLPTRLLGQDMTQGQFLSGG